MHLHQLHVELAVHRQSPVSSVDMSMRGSRSARNAYTAVGCSSFDCSNQHLVKIKGPMLLCYCWLSHTSNMNNRPELAETYNTTGAGCSCEAWLAVLSQQLTLLAVGLDPGQVRELAVD